MVAEIIFSLLASVGSTKQNLDNEFDCLAKNIYFEARNQSTIGQFAVGMVTINRVKDSRFPNTICGVVKQARTYKNGFPIRNKCHFSWYCDGLSDKIRNHKAYQIAQEIAEDVLVVYESGFDPTDGATHYHAVNVNPYWTKEKTLLGRVDDHIFYRWDK